MKRPALYGFVGFASIGFVSLVALTCATTAIAIPFNPGRPKIAPIPKATPTSFPPEPTLTEAVAPQPAPKPQFMAEPIVRSQQNLDYERLQDLMKSGAWEEANQLNSRILLTLGKGEDQGYLTASQIAKLPCGALRTVDDLWRYYSGGRSGLIAQAKVWRQMKGKDIKQVKKFEALVGWHKGVLNPNPKAAQIGHMPLRPTGEGGTPEGAGGWWVMEMPKRLETCGMIPKQPVEKSKPKPQVKPKKG